MGWLRKRIRRWRRGTAGARCGASVPATTGTLIVAACHPAGAIVSPVLKTVFRRGLFYGGMEDVELRGFLDGTVKFERNVATQYHVRVGCEGSKPDRGRYEVMRLLQRWDTTALPPSAQVRGARLVLCQEDIAGFPHRHPLRWPVDFYLYAVKKPWNPGRGGSRRDNVSSPEPGDAWWLEAKAGELKWAEAGCGFGADNDAQADRKQHPLASCRLGSVDEDLIFSGSRLARHIEKAAQEGSGLDLLIAAGPADEALPGSTRAFYSAEFGDDLNPQRRPRLEVEWCSPARWVEEHPFVLGPGETIAFRPQSGTVLPEPATLCASVDVDSVSGMAPAADVLGWNVSNAPESAGLLPLAVPLLGSPGRGFEIRLSTALHPIAAGDEVSIRILETWMPSVRRPEELAVPFWFTAPSGRKLAHAAVHEGDFLYACRFRPDEMGVWSYAWTTRPDRRFRPQTGGGRFTVVRSEGRKHEEALRSFVESALDDSQRERGLLARRRSHFRLVTAQREITSFFRAEERRGVQREDLERLRELLRRIGEALPRFE